MKVLRIGSCLLLLLTQTIFMGCSKEKEEKEKAALHHKCTQQHVTHPLTISNCSTDEVVEVCNDDSVAWTAQDDNYQITFVGSPVPTISSFPVPHGKKVSQPIHGPNGCSAAGCYYKYNLNTRNDAGVVSPPCRDPGIRILP